MTARQETDENGVDYLLLADDDFSDFLADQLQVGNRRFENRFRAHIFNLTGAG